MRPQKLDINASKDRGSRLPEFLYRPQLTILFAIGRFRQVIQVTNTA